MGVDKYGLMWYNHGRKLRRDKMQVEYNKEAIKEDSPICVGKSLVAITPAIGEDYWLIRVPVSENQAVVCFPKFFTIGIGFQKETDWNTNLPYTCSSEQIFNHISHNKGDDSITDESCIEAIELLQNTINVGGINHG